MTDNYYKINKIRPMLRGWSYVRGPENSIRTDYCPLCKMTVKLVSVGMMNYVVWNHKLVWYPRCESCLMKLPAPKYFWKIQNWSHKPSRDDKQKVLEVFNK